MVMNKIDIIFKNIFEDCNWRIYYIQGLSHLWCVKIVYKLQKKMAREEIKKKFIGYLQ